MGLRENRLGRALIGAAVTLAIAACGQAAPSAAVAEAQAQSTAPVEAAKLPRPWLPTMDTLRTPILDFASPLRKGAERSYLKAHEAAFQAAVARLADRDRLGVEALRTVLGDDPLGQASLMRLALSGALLREGRAGATALSGLAELAVAPLAEGIDRATLLNETIAEIDEPGRVGQGLKLTCESATVQILLMRRDPAEYVRLVAGLASPTGKVTLANGESIARVPDWRSKTDGWRSIPCRLIQPAFAGFGNLPLAYSNTKDRNELGASGLTDAQSVKLLAGVFGRPFKYLSPENSTAAERMAAFRKARAAGWECSVWVEWFTGHIVLAQDEANGRVVIDNPYGSLHSLQSEAFEKVLHSVYVPR